MGQGHETTVDGWATGRTVLGGFLETVGRRPEARALRGGVDDEGITFSEYRDRVARAAAALADRGVGKDDRVVLLMANSPTFHVLDLAVLACGAVPVSVYGSSSPEQVAHLCGHSGARLALAGGEDLAGRFAAAEGVDVLDVHDPAVDLTGTGHALDLEAAAARSAPEDLATVIYTSGTTGAPKGVRITHRNVVWTVESLRRCFGPDADLAGKRVISYLPMAHIAERMTSHYSQALWGYDVTCCPDPAQFASFLAPVRPQVVFGVPRVWEKLHAGLLGLAGAAPDADPEPAVFGPLLDALGLGEAEFAITGSAPIRAELVEWFNAVGIPLSEIYGLSESSGPISWSPHDGKPGTVGRPIPGCEVRVAADGEILCRGGNVFDGYLDDPARTAEVLRDGWLHTGDVGAVDDDGHLRIVDRKKELLITAGGKNVSPANLEAALTTIPLVGQACAVGDGRPFVAALVVLDGELAPRWAVERGLGERSLRELAEHPEVVAAVEQGVAEAMAPFSQAERVKRVRILAAEWLPDSEELTPTSKLKRRVIATKYAAEIESLYAG